MRAHSTPGQARFAVVTPPERRPSAALVVPDGRTAVVTLLAHDSSAPPGTAVVASCVRVRSSKLRHRRLRDGARPIVVGAATTPADPNRALALRIDIRHAPCPLLPAPGRQYTRP